MHDLDRQQLEQYEREGLAGLPELAQPESYAASTARPATRPLPPGHTARLPAAAAGSVAGRTSSCSASSDAPPAQHTKEDSMSPPAVAPVPRARSRTPGPRAAHARDARPHRQPADRPTSGSGTSSRTAREAITFENYKRVHRQRRGRRPAVPRRRGLPDAQDRHPRLAAARGRRLAAARLVDRSPAGRSCPTELDDAGRRFKTPARAELPRAIRRTSRRRGAAARLPRQARGRPQGPAVPQAHRRLARRPAAEGPTRSSSATTASRPPSCSGRCCSS